MRFICLILICLLGSPAIAQVQTPVGTTSPEYLHLAQITRPTAPKVHSTEEQIEKLRKDIKEKRDRRAYILERYGISPNESAMILAELSYVQAKKRYEAAIKALKNAPTARNKRLAKEADADLLEAYKKLRQAFADFMKRFPEGQKGELIGTKNDILYMEFDEYEKIIFELDACIQLLKKLTGK